MNALLVGVHFFLIFLRFSSCFSTIFITCVLRNIGVRDIVRLESKKIIPILLVSRSESLISSDSTKAVHNYNIMFSSNTIRCSSTGSMSTIACLICGFGFS